MSTNSRSSTAASPPASNTISPGSVNGRPPSRQVSYTADQWLYFEIVFRAILVVVYVCGPAILVSWMPKAVRNAAAGARDFLLRNYDLHLDEQYLRRAIAPPLRRICRELSRLRVILVCMILTGLADYLVLDHIYELETYDFGSYVAGHKGRSSAVVVLCLLVLIWASSGFDQDYIHWRWLVYGAIAGNQLINFNVSGGEYCCWFLEAWAVLAVQATLFGILLLGTVCSIGDLWLSIFSYSELLEYYFCVFDFELRLGMISESDNPFLVNLSCLPYTSLTRKQSQSLFYQMKTHLARFVNLAGEEFGAHVRLPHFEVPTVGHWRAALAKKHFIVPSHRWVALVDDESGELLLDDCCPLPMTDPTVIIYALSRHVPDPVPKLATVAERADLLLALRMTEFSGDHYFGIGEGEYVWRETANYEHLAVPLRSDPDIIEALLSQGSYFLVPFLRSCDLSRHNATAAVVRSILGRNEELSRRTVRRYWSGDGALDKESSCLLLHDSAKEDEEYMRYLLYTLRRAPSPFPEDEGELMGSEGMLCGEHETVNNSGVGIKLMEGVHI